MATIKKTQQMLVRMLGERSPYTQLVEMLISRASMEICMEVPQKNKNGTAI
jgi:hypothetical protein